MSEPPTPHPTPPPYPQPDRKGLAPAPLCSTFQADLAGMLDDTEFADVVFVVEGRRFHAHRAVLAARCEHFRVMFSSGMRESHEREIRISGTRYALEGH